MSPARRHPATKPAPSGASAFGGPCIPALPVLLFKTEPGEFAFADLQARGRSRWDGVTAPAAVLALRGARAGDLVWIYHSGGDKAVVGIARCLGDAYADPARPDRTKAGEVRYAVVDLEAVRSLPTPVTLDALKREPACADLPMLKQSRLSVMRVSPGASSAIARLAGL